jgi:hypothetical protein
MISGSRQLPAVLGGGSDRPGSFFLIVFLLNSLLKIDDFRLLAAPGRPGRRLRLAQVILSYCFLIKLLLEVVDFRLPAAPGRSADLQLCRSADLQLCKSADLQIWRAAIKKGAWNG